MRSWCVMVQLGGRVVVLEHGLTRCEAEDMAESRGGWAEQRLGDRVQVLPRGWQPIG